MVIRQWISSPSLCFIHTLKSTLLCFSPFTSLLQLCNSIYCIEVNIVATSWNYLMSYKRLKMGFFIVLLIFVSQLCPTFKVENKNRKKCQELTQDAIWVLCLLPLAFKKIWGKILDFLGRFERNFLK